MTDEQILMTVRADEAAPDPLALARGRRQLLDHIAAGSAMRTPAVRRPFLLAGGVAAALACGAVVAVGALPGAADADAAALLQRVAAATSAAVPDPTPGPGQFLYVQKVRNSLQNPLLETDPWGPVCAGVVEQWHPSGSGAVTWRYLLGIAPEAGPAAAPGTPFQDGCHEQEDGTTEHPEASGGWQDPDPAFVAGLPTDPRALYDRARADAADYDDRDTGTFTLLTDLGGSSSPYLTPDVRAALLGALALVPGVELGEPARSLFGAEGVTVRRTREGSRTELIIDERTGVFLGERDVAVAGNPMGLPPGTVVDEVATRTAVVDRIGERPGG